MSVRQSPTGSAPSIGGGITGGTDGSVLFIHPVNVLAQDNPDFKYDLSTSVLNLGNGSAYAGGAFAGFQGFNLNRLFTEPLTSIQYNYTGIDLNIEGAPSANTSGYPIGIVGMNFTSTVADASTWGTVLGLNAGTYITGAADVTNTTGAIFHIFSDTNGTVANAYGFQTSINNQSFNTLSQAIGGYFGENLGDIDYNYGSYIAPQSRGFSFNAGLYVGDQSGSSAGGNSYNLYSAGATSVNRFEGRLDVGDADFATYFYPGFTKYIGYFEKTFTDAIASYDVVLGTASIVNLKPVTNDGTGSVYGNLTYALTDPADTGDWNSISGGLFVTYLLGSGHTQALVGGYFQSESAAGTIDLNAAGRFNTNVVQATNNYGIYVDPAIVVSGTNNYGIYVNNQIGSGATNDWNIWSGANSGFSILDSDAANVFTSLNGHAYALVGISESATGGVTGVTGWGITRGTNGADGGDFYAAHYGTGTVNSVLGSFQQALNENTGTITHAYSLFGASVVNEGGGTITNAYTIYADTNVKTNGTLTNNYGLYLADQDGVGSNLSYNLYSAGAGGNLFQGHSAIGANATINDFYGSPAPVLLGFKETFTEDFATGLVTNLTYNPTNNGGEFDGLVLGVFSKDTNTKDIANMFAISGGVAHAGSGDVTSEIAAQNSYSALNGSGNVANAHVYSGDVEGSGSGTIAQAAVFYARQGGMSGAGTITNYYGFYSEDVGGGVNVSNAWNFYSAGATAKNYFAGLVGIGTSTPTEALHVVGNAIVTGDDANLGSEIFSQNTFTPSHTLWFTDPGDINFVGNVPTYVATGSGGDLYQNKTDFLTPVVIGKTYRMTIVLANCTAGDSVLQFLNEATVIATVPITNGTHSADFLYIQANYPFYLGVSGTTGTFEVVSMSLKEVQGGLGTFNDISTGWLSASSGLTGALGLIGDSSYITSGIMNLGNLSVQSAITVGGLPDDIEGSLTVNQSNDGYAAVINQLSQNPVLLLNCKERGFYTQTSLSSAVDLASYKDKDFNRVCVIDNQGNMRLGTDGTEFSRIGGTIKLFGTSSGYTIIQSAASDGTWTLTLPADDGSANQFLQTDGSGVSSWASAPEIVANIDLTGRTAAITATTAYTPSSTGMYRLTVYLQVTTAASVSSVLGGATGVVITYNDGDGNVAQTDTMGLFAPNGTVVSTINTNTTATNLTGSIEVYAKTGVAIQYAIGYTSVGTAMAYAAHIRVEKI